MKLEGPGRFLPNATDMPHPIEYAILPVISPPSPVTRSAHTSSYTKPAMPQRAVILYMGRCVVIVRHLMRPEHLYAGPVKRIPNLYGGIVGAADQPLAFALPKHLKEVHASSAHSGAGMYACHAPYLQGHNPDIGRHRLLVGIAKIISSRLCCPVMHSHLHDSYHLRTHPEGQGDIRRYLTSPIRNIPEIDHPVVTLRRTAIKPYQHSCMVVPTQSKRTHGDLPQRQVCHRRERRRSLLPCGRSTTVHRSSSRGSKPTVCGTHDEIHPIKDATRPAASL